MHAEATEKVYTREEGPAAYLNWLAARHQKPLLCTFEYPLYTDAHIVAEAQHGPYTFLNAIAMPHGVVRPAVVLRYDCHWQFPHPDWSRTNAERYHGGTPADEIAALASLAMEVRFRAGDSSREFRPGGDPKGRPIALTRRGIPLLTLGSSHRWVLPLVAEGQHSLELLQPLSMLPDLNPDAALTLIRCARLYQDALWLAESQPALAWLLLESALETAAVYWRSQREEALLRFRTENCELYDDLFQLDPTMPNRVADTFKDSFGVTKKFVDFVLKFRPPEPRPGQRPRWAVIDWSDSSLKRILKTIYKYRSKALHEGRPFPAPMCEPPYSAADCPVLTEKPHGHTSMSGGVWLEKDIPLLLHTFAYIARPTLLNWWLAQAPQEH